MLKNLLHLLTLFLLFFTLVMIAIKPLGGLALISLFLTIGCFIVSLIWSDKTEQRKAEEYHRSVFPWLYNDK